MRADFSDFVQCAQTVLKLDNVTVLLLPLQLRQVTPRGYSDELTFTLIQKL